MSELIPKKKWWQLNWIYWFYILAGIAWTIYSIQILLRWNGTQLTQIEFGIAFIITTYFVSKSGEYRK